jgi:hypothetical protein
MRFGEVVSSRLFSVRDSGIRKGIIAQLGSATKHPANDIEEVGLVQTSIGESILCSPTRSITDSFHFLGKRS